MHYNADKRDDKSDKASAYGKESSVSIESFSGLVRACVLSGVDEHFIRSLVIFITL